MDLGRASRLYHRLLAVNLYIIKVKSFIEQPKSSLHNLAAEKKKKEKKNNLSMCPVMEGAQHKFLNKKIKNKTKFSI